MTALCYSANARLPVFATDAPGVAIAGLWGTQLHLGAQDYTRLDRWRCVSTGTAQPRSGQVINRELLDADLGE